MVLIMSHKTLSNLTFGRNNGSDLCKRRKAIEVIEGKQYGNSLRQRLYQFGQHVFIY